MEKIIVLKKVLCLKRYLTGTHCNADMFWLPCLHMCTEYNDFSLVHNVCLPTLHNRVSGFPFFFLKQLMFSSLANEAKSDKSQTI